MHDTVLITKATGEKEPFEPHKLKHSLLRAKASSELADKIISHIELELKDGISTKEIYSHAFELLEREQKPAAIRYSLRNAVMDMGPTGFPFENLISEIWRAKGFETTTDFIATGKCVDHEIDVVAWNENKLIMVEAKFHNEFGLKSDLKAVLYVNSRWEDLKDKTFDFGKQRNLDEGWLVTNTKFSEQAIKYAKCRGMKLIGWNYPAEGNLQDLIEDTGLHPITSLLSLSSREKRSLMESGVIHLRQILANKDILNQAGVSLGKMEKVMQEIEMVGLK
ncbi:MAG TPA: restriction endonuclease [Candidatus Paceibacterota bacterium]